MRVVVVGAGVSGMTCAIRLLEAGADVLVVTAGDPRGTTSAVAGAMAGPVFGSGGEETLVWEQESDRVFRELAADGTSGVRLIRGRLLSSPSIGPGLPPWAASVPGYRPCTADELPPGFSDGFWAELPFADMPTYLAWLVRRAHDLGGRIEQNIVTDLAGASELLDPTADVVVNCSGLGAERLASDPSVEPVWGQHVIVDAPEVNEFVMEGGGSGDSIGIVPHARGLLLGGVRIRGRRDLSPDAEIAAETVRRAAVAVPEVADAPILAIEVGLRPSRPRVRLEAETNGDLTVVHDYGHDGSGVFWSWGCAREVVSLCGLEGDPRQR